LTELVQTISHRVVGYLERQGILERDEENSYLNLEEGAEDPMQQVLGCSVSYRTAGWDSVRPKVDARICYVLDPDIFISA
jgi:hypothetical protein